MFFFKNELYKSSKTSFRLTHQLINAYLWTKGRLRRRIICIYIPLRQDVLIANDEN
jgi:hypothetical protein